MRKKIKKSEKKKKKTYRFRSRNALSFEVKETILAAFK